MKGAYGMFIKGESVVEEQLTVVGLQQSRAYTNDQVAHAAVVIPSVSPRWTEYIPLILAYAGFMGLGLVSIRLGVTWTSIRATFGMPIDAIGILLIAQLVG
ncbi:MAG: hypothetical protein R3307_08580, partial [Anaerolineales bacterium]|nr:hypothetical protein [Anaerolineales bacterium]